MNLKQNEVYVCLEPCCRAEIVVRKGADPTCPGKFALRCCCGKKWCAKTGWSVRSRGAQLRQLEAASRRFAAVCKWGGP